MVFLRLFGVGFLFLALGVPLIKWGVAKSHPVKHAPNSSQCVAILANGKRCSKGRWPMSKYCAEHDAMYGAAKR